MFRSKAAGRHINLVCEMRSFNDSSGILHVYGHWTVVTNYCQGVCLSKSNGANTIGTLTNCWKCNVLVLKIENLNFHLKQVFYWIAVIFRIILSSYSWVQARPPLEAGERMVTPRSRRSDELHTSTVIPYLVERHYPSAQEYFTERDYRHGQSDDDTDDELFYDVTNLQHRLWWWRIVLVYSRVEWDDCLIYCSQH